MKNTKKMRGNDEHRKARQGIVDYIDGINCVRKFRVTYKLSMICRFSSKIVLYSKFIIMYGLFRHLGDPLDFSVFKAASTASDACNSTSIMFHFSPRIGPFDTAAFAFIYAPTTTFRNSRSINDDIIIRIITT